MLIVEDWPEVRRLPGQRGCRFRDGSFDSQVTPVFGFRGVVWDRFAADAVAQHQEWQPEEPECVIGAQLAVGDVDIEFLFETRHP